MKKILVVDDETVSLLMTENILNEKFNVVCASSGIEAIEKFKAEMPDLVLSDLRMPNMTGFELQKTLNSIAGKNVPFMFMTADTDDATESIGFENGALDFIKKPFRADVLLKRISNIIRSVEMKKAATLDSMTGLLNKLSSKNMIGEAVSSGAGVLMMVDLDSFKPVNDIYGHSAGDMILLRFSEILQASVRRGDLVGRMGGDEFIIFCRDIKDESVIEKKSIFINKSVQEAAKEFLGEDCAIPLGASIGCAFAPADGTDFQTLAEKADKALYEVKRNGKHGFRFFKEEINSSTLLDSGKDVLSAAIQILKERAQEKGAFPLPFEQFRTVYRFLVRLNANYGTRIWLLTLSLKCDGVFSESDSALLFETLRTSLRQSDVITESARGQFLVLLMHIEAEDISMLIERIQKNLSDSSGIFSIESEIAPLV